MSQGILGNITKIGDLKVVGEKSERWYVGYLGDLAASENRVIYNSF
jgi:hypothetical protein